MDDLGQGATSVPAAPQDLHAGRTVMAEGLSDLPKGKTGHALPMTASSAGMFATTLRSRRARQKSALPPLRWLPRFVVGRSGADKVIGAQVDMSQLWLSVPRRTLRKSRRKSLGQQQREFDSDLLGNACAQAATWPEGMRLMVSLEDDQAPDGDFNNRLNTVLQESGFPVSRLDLVFQESGLAQDDKETCYTLSALRDQGCQIFLGGFGSAPSSLSLLRERAMGGLLDGVQFDASMLAPSGMTWRQSGDAPLLDESATVFYRAALETVKALGLKVRSIGVDLPDLLAFVQKVGCVEASGTVLAAPETTAQISERFEETAGRPRRRRMARTAEGL
ncbi:MULTISPECIES: EAL domain-containing protein [Gluconobacter]|uniref:EAL domain-containing protein n=1 Tax=Gluconobacter TaxID=441 RepID=UPI001E4F1F26|nr:MULTISPECIES: EAL domain-containing protein [Gluconobacter]